MSHPVLERPAGESADRRLEPSRLSEQTVKNPLPARRGSAGAALACAGRSVPTILVLVLLGSVGYYGHNSDWSLPKFSALTGAVSAESADWCEEHGVAESQCVECNADLMPKGPDYGWCAEHGVHNCLLHHPDIAQLKEIPTVSKADLARAARALVLVDRKQNNAVCTTYQKRIQFASMEAARQAGVDIDLVERQSINESVKSNGEITYDPTRLASLASRVPGTAWRVEKNIGDRVQAGDV